ncbi:putative membrane protein DUF2254 [Albidovulum inexpectatum]|uniref:Putative membrane protein DUF2254 n=1 Tax=Albidovulum inexpectatum TaxID=196587 RepID=A0A2S5JIV2_9RHOB|nr:DUF2254 domain-containing protein [Albidovulum inexpectatum]PPB81175.1 putative membrane protein DUF2254 [Albidovulum inexpectatum]
MKLSSARLRKIIYEIRASYWAVPAGLALVAGIAAEGLAWIDALPWVEDFLGDRLVSAPEDARNTLSLIASSSIGVAGMMFSITMVAVTFASGQYGPRLIGNFMRDRGSQWSLGILIATFVFAMLVLRGVEARGPDGTGAYVPRISLLIAIVMAFLSVGTMIFFVHHVPETINVSHIISALGRRLCRRVTEIVPQIPECAQGLSPVRDAPIWHAPAGTSGHIQAYDPDGMAQIAVDAGARITLLPPPGRFVSADDPAFEIVGAERSDDLIQRLQATLAIGDDRTEEQDVGFLIDQLVEVAVRALSPGINDPYTAVYCMDWMMAALLRAAREGIGQIDTPPALLVLPAPRPEDLVERSLGACLPYARQDAIARAALSDILRRLQDQAGGEIAKAAARLAHQLKAEETP